MAAKKYTKKDLVKLAKEFNKVMDFDNPIDVKADEAGLVKGIKSEVDSLFTADKDTLSDAAWEYATKVLKLTPEDGGTEGEPEPEVEEEPPKETAAEKKARLKAEKKAAKAADKPDAKKAPATTEKKKAASGVKTDTSYKRHDAALASIRELCKRKKGASMKEIMEKSDTLFVAKGGKSNPGATNVHRYILIGLVEFGVLREDGKRYFID